MNGRIWSLLWADDPEMQQAFRSMTNLEVFETLILVRKLQELGITELAVRIEAVDMKPMD